MDEAGSLRRATEQNHENSRYSIHYGIFGRQLWHFLYMCRAMSDRPRTKSGTKSGHEYLLDGRSQLTYYNNGRLFAAYHAIQLGPNLRMTNGRHEIIWPGSDLNPLLALVVLRCGQISQHASMRQWCNGPTTPTLFAISTSQVWTKLYRTLGLGSWRFFAMDYSTPPGPMGGGGGGLEPSRINISPDWVNRKKMPGSQT